MKPGYVVVFGKAAGFRHHGEVEGGRGRFEFHHDTMGSVGEMNHLRGGLQVVFFSDAMDSGLTVEKNDHFSGGFGVEAPVATVGKPNFGRCVINPLPLVSSCRQFKFSSYKLKAQDAIDAIP